MLEVKKRPSTEKTASLEKVNPLSKLYTYSGFNSGFGIISTPLFSLILPMSSMFGDLNPVENRKFSFKFLLERENNTSILSNFNLEIIQNYFPEYKNEIQNWINHEKD